MSATARDFLMQSGICPRLSGLIVAGPRVLKAILILSQVQRISLSKQKATPLLFLIARALPKARRDPFDLAHEILEPLLPIRAGS